jgi:hypothetical protein
MPEFFQTVISICRLPHPTRSFNRIVCRGQEGPKGRKGTKGFFPGKYFLCFLRKASVTRNKEVVRKF